jgi:hypothetical protein
LLEKPKLLRSKDLNFAQDETTPDYWTPGEFQAEYVKADDFGKLILLLAANCGMYGSDMAHFRWDGSK